MIVALATNPVVKQTARTADRFKLDPVMILDDQGDEWPHVLRAACLRVVEADDAKRNERERAEMSKNKPRKR